MATSGVTSFQLTRDQLIEAAISKLGVLASGQTPDAADYDKGALFLNTLVAQLRTMQVPLWARNSYSFSLTANVATYNIGVGQTLNTPYPLKMLQAYSLQTTGTTKVPIDIVSDFVYNILPLSSTGSYPVQLTYQPKVNLGVIKVWPTPDTATAANTTITIVYQRPFEYFSNSTDTMDIPEEWYNAIIYKLAVLLAPDWGVPLEDRRELKAEAKQYWDEAESFGTEDSSTYFYPIRR
jgi:hypothetical protein